MKKKNKFDEEIFLTSRINNDGKVPWDRCVENIELKEGSYPGSNNIDRMKECIIGRRNDMRAKK